MTDQSDQAIIDIPRAIQLAAGKPDLAKDLFDMLIASLPDARSNISAKYQDGDADILFQEIHRLQGACRYCGVPALLHACQQAEAYVKNSGTDGLSPLLDSVFKEIAALQDWAANNVWQAP